MDVGGINRLRQVFTEKVQPEVRPNHNSTADRDAQGGSGYHQQKVTVLNPEQELEALERLNSLPHMKKEGLIGELVRGDGVATHIVIKNAAGEVLRHIPFEQLVELYLNRKSENDTGLLLKKSA